MPGDRVFLVRQNWKPRRGVGATARRPRSDASSSPTSSQRSRPGSSPSWRPAGTRARRPRRTGRPRTSRARSARRSDAHPACARLRRPAARPHGGDGLAADARARGDARRRPRARRPRAARPARCVDPARRQLRRRVGIRPPERRSPRAALHAVTDLGNIQIVVGLALAARRRRRSPPPEPLVVPLPARRARRHGGLDARRQGSRRAAPADAQPGRRDARAVVPERPFGDRGGVLRRGGADHRPSPAAAARAIS